MEDSTYPKTLSEIQHWFAKIITIPIRESDAANIPLYSSALITEIQKHIAPSPHLKSEERIGIYQQQYWWRLLGICQEIFPTLVRLLGYEDFNLLIAEPYLLKYPPKEWFLSHIGVNLPKWLKKDYRKSDPLVLELAKLDVAYESLHFTKLLPKIDPNLLSTCEEKKLFLQPSVLLFESHFDLFTFRSELLQNSPEYYETNLFPKVKEHAEKRYFALFQNMGSSSYEEISFPFFTLLTQFKKGAKLIDLIPLLETIPNLLETFQLMATRGWLTLSNPRRRSL